ncbi:hypothetical protein SOPP22_04465 [Shewanella sp. OPT22]|nr:hypothetical protein SOPP22_04465 [Shewanella sp. OPT22]
MVIIFSLNSLAEQQTSNNRFPNNINLPVHPASTIADRYNNVQGSLLSGKIMQTALFVSDDDVNEVIKFYQTRGVPN